MTELPDDVPMVFRELRTAEMNTRGREGQPLTWSALSGPLVLLFALVVLNALIQRGCRFGGNEERSRAHLRHLPSPARPPHLMEREPPRLPGR